MQIADSDRREIIRCLRQGIPLPEKFRFLLFPTPLDHELVWQGKTRAVREHAVRFRTLGAEALLEPPPGSQAPPLSPSPVPSASPPFSAPFSPSSHPDSVWRDTLILGDNSAVLASLGHEPFRSRIKGAGGIRLIYCDPPFAVGADFYLSSGGEQNGKGKGEKNPAQPGRKTAQNTAAARLAYSDTWGPGKSAFLSMMHERLLLMRRVLAPRGSIYLHCDWRTSALLRLLMDEVFGAERFLGEIIWHYTGGGRARRWFSRKHDTLLHYAASDQWTFNTDAVRVPYKKSSGYARGGIVSAAGKRYSPNPLGTPVDDVWDLPIINPLARERLGYPTQKPESLLERVILASSDPGDLVADFFCGSGTTPAVARRLGRRWLAVDKSAPAVETARMRLAADAKEGAGFDVLECCGDPDPPAAARETPDAEPV